MSQVQWSNEIGESQKGFERLEGELWANHLFRSSNPVLLQCAGFIRFLFDIIAEDEFGEIPRMDVSQLTPLEILEAEELAKYFSGHSHFAFNKVSDWIPQWLA